MILTAMPHLSDHNLETLAASLHRNGLNSGAAKMILQTFWSANGRIDCHEISVAKLTRKWLGDNCPPMSSRVIHSHRSLDGTSKFLIGIAGGGSVECVLMPSHRPGRAAACVSSQIGCAMSCDFCASTRGGLERDLSAGEIVEQFLHLRHFAATENRRIASLVFMGMGEPLHNFENVVSAIRLMIASALGNFGARAITVSTVGLVREIDRLAELDLGVHLALSLHAPDDETRNKIVPPNRRWTVAQIMAAAKRFQEKTNRVVNIEYCLLAGVNDSDAQAEMLAELMQDFRAHVNLIPHNPIGAAGLKGIAYQRPSEARIAEFLRILRENGIVSHVRQTRGDEVSAACGQLRKTTLAVVG